MPEDLDPEDAKLITLARSARTRAYAPHTGHAEGAAVRDSDGRTYAAATVEHEDPSLTTSALRAAVVAAAGSGARAFEAVAVVADPARTPDLDEARLLLEFGDDTVVLVADPDGSVERVLSAAELA